MRGAVTHLVLGYTPSSQAFELVLLAPAIVHLLPLVALVSICLAVKALLGPLALVMLLPIVANTPRVRIEVAALALSSCLLELPPLNALPDALDQDEG